MILNIGVSVRTLMESANRGQIPVCGVDYFGDMDSCIGGQTESLALDYNLEPNLKNLMQVAADIPCEALVYTSGPENVPELLTSWENRGLLCGNGYKSLKSVRNPFVLNRSLQEIGMKMPEFFTVNNFQQIKKGKEYLLKPIDRGSGHGIKYIPSDLGEMQRLLKPYIELEASRYIIEEYIPGIPGSMTFLATGKEAVVLGTSQQLIFERSLKHPFCYQGNIVPLNFGKACVGAKLMKQLDMVAEKLVLDFGLKGLNTLDFILQKDKIWPLELNPRWSASVELLEESFGTSLYSAHLDACMGKLSKVKKKSSNNQYYGKLIVYCAQDLMVNENIAQQWETLYTKGIRDLPRVLSKINQGCPLCTVLAQGDSLEQCYQKLKEKAQWVQRVYLNDTACDSWE